MAKTGRPTSYSQNIADAICEEIATTDHSLRRICANQFESASCIEPTAWSSAWQPLRKAGN
jgi:hypothetical protein